MISPVSKPTYRTPVETASKASAVTLARSPLPPLRLLPRRPPRHTRLAVRVNLAALAKCTSSPSEKAIDCSWGRAHNEGGVNVTAMAEQHETRKELSAN